MTRIKLCSNLTVRCLPNKYCQTEFIAGRQGESRGKNRALDCICIIQGAIS